MRYGQSDYAFYCVLRTFERLGLLCVMQAKERWFVLIANRFIYVPDTQPLPIPLHRQWHLTLFIMRFIYLQAYYGQ